MEIITTYRATDGKVFDTIEKCQEHEKEILEGIEKDKILEQLRAEFPKRFFKVQNVSCDMTNYLLDDMMDCMVESFICFDEWKRVYESETAVERWDEIPDNMVNGKRYVVFKTDINNSAKVIDPEELKQRFCKEVDSWVY